MILGRYKFVAVAVALVAALSLDVDLSVPGQATVSLMPKANALFIRRLARRARRAFRRFTNRVRRGARQLGNRIRGAFNRAGQAIRGAANRVGKAFRGAVKGAGRVFRKVASGVRSGWATLVSGAQRLGATLRRYGIKALDYATTGLNAARTFLDPSGYVRACAARSRTRIKGPCNGSGRFCAMRYDQVTQAMSHNAMAALRYVWTPGYANHCQTMTTQLDDGIRGLMLDSHDDGGRTFLCHGSCKAGRIPLAKGLREIRVWLDRHPKQVVTINWENGVSGAQMQAAMNESGLMRYVYVRAPGTDWPTLAQMITRNKRLVLFTSSADGAFPGFHSVDGNTWENGFAYKRDQDFACTRRYGGGPVFTLNHFLTNPVGSPYLAQRANRKASIVRHARKCQREVGLKPTFIAVDWYELGDVLQAVKALNGLR